MRAFGGDDESDGVALELPRRSLGSRSGTGVRISFTVVAMIPSKWRSHGWRLTPVPPEVFDQTGMKFVQREWEDSTRPRIVVHLKNGLNLNFRSRAVQSDPRSSPSTEPPRPDTQPQGRVEVGDHLIGPSDSPDCGRHPLIPLAEQIPRDIPFTDRYGPCLLDTPTLCTGRWGSGGVRCCDLLVRQPNQKLEHIGRASSCVHPTPTKSIVVLIYE